MAAYAALFSYSAAKSRRLGRIRLFHGEGKLRAVFLRIVPRNNAGWEIRLVHSVGIRNWFWTEAAPLLRIISAFCFQRAV